MKKISLLLFFAAAFAASATAQNYQFGHINTGELVSLMAETDSARVKLNAYSQELSEEMDAMQTEYSSKLNTYQQKSATWTDAIRQSKEAELQEIIQRLQQFEQTAQQDLGQMQQTLMAPVYEKAQNAINKVAKDNNLIFVFDTASGSIVYKNDDKSLDLLPLAKKELGIPAEKVAPTQLAQPQE